ncbi:TPA: hypothetical protein P6430_003867 [Escherichia coli]|nr:hypothetical protein [Escherichia coli]
MKELIKVVLSNDVHEVIKCWGFICEKDAHHVFNVDVNYIIAEVKKECLCTFEIGYLFFLASKPTFVPASPDAITLSVRDIRKIAKHIWREQKRRHSAERRAAGFDDGFPF